jgi:RNA polymerase sigma-70 factor (ECF subfamily)
MASDVLTVDLRVGGHQAEGGEFTRMESRGSMAANGRSAPPGARVEKQRAGEQDLAQVYDAHSDYVFRCLRSLGVSPSQLEDAVQDVFIVVHQKLASFDGKSALRTWLYAIVIRIARKKRVARARWSAKEGAEEVDSASTDCTEQKVLAKEELALAHRALSSLDRDKREVFVLLEIEQMSAPEVAEVLSLPVNTVYSRLRLARIAFNRELERLLRSGNSTHRGRHG